MIGWLLRLAGRWVMCPLGLWLVPTLGLSTASCSLHGDVPPEHERHFAKGTVLKRWQDLSSAPLSPHQGPLTLEQAIEEALRASPELEQIRQRVDAAAEQVRQAEAVFYPRLIAAEEYSVTNNPVYALMNIINQRRLQSDVDFNHPGQQHDFATRIQAEWSLFEGGSSWFARKAAIGSRESIARDLLGARNALVAKVTETYYQWLEALNFIGVADRALESARTDERLGEARVKAEVALPSELLRLKARTAEMHGNLVTSRTGARRLQAGLERLLARPIRAEEIPSPSLSVPPSGTEDVGERADSLALVNRALERRPEIASIESLIQAARARVRAAQGRLLPDLGASAQYQWNSEEFGEGVNSWMAGIRLTWPLFEGGITLARIREARFRLKEIEARGEQVALDIALEVHQATLAVQEAAEKIRVADERKKYAQSALGEVRHLYREQMVTVDSLLQAEVSWNQATVSYTAALFEGKIAQALLRKSLGDFADWMDGRND
jgi:outer membrane protein